MSLIDRPGQQLAGGEKLGSFCLCATVLHRNCPPPHPHSQLEQQGGMCQTSPLPFALPGCNFDQSECSYWDDAVHGLKLILCFRGSLLCVVVTGQISFSISWWKEYLPFSQRSLLCLQSKFLREAMSIQDVCLSVSSAIPALPAPAAFESLCEAVLVLSDILSR